MKSIYKLISLFSKKEKNRLVLIAAAVLFASLLEIVEVGSLGPFMALAADPDMVNRQPVLAFLYRLGGFEGRNSNSFLIFLGIAIFILIIAVSAVRTGVFYIAFRFAANRRYTLSLRLFRQYLFQPYHFFLNHNTGELSKNLLSEVDMVINSVLWPAMNIFTRGMLALAIFVFLVILNPFVAVLAAVVFCILYFGAYAFVRPRLNRHGRDALEANRLRFKAAAEAFGGIKELKILGKESSFINAYAQGARRFAVSQSANQIYSTLPAQVIHSLAIGFAIALVVIFLALSNSMMEILPLLTVYAFAVIRLVPNVQNVFQSAAQVRYSAFIVDELYQDMTKLVLPPETPLKDVPVTTRDVLPFTRSIELKDIQFSYTASREPVLKNINLVIHKNTTVAFAGTTGCGKTTLADLVMGLLEPAGGSISVDGAPVTALAPWQRNFGYVPQQIYLTDDTVAANIAFGVPENLRETGALEQAAKVANLHEFIVNELPEAYNTLVGEQGIRLSGGQRQRVGIARALYHNPNILVMDEATSSLDSVTEDAVMEAIHKLMHTKTIIIIAHRLSSIRESDVIYMMEHGSITTSGTYNGLLQNSAQFRALAKMGTGTR